MIAKSKLGRGLNELLSEISAQSSSELSTQQPNTLAVETLIPGKYQPRKDMNYEALEELANSIRAQGIIQPIIVRPIGAGRYEIIAGERRWRAAQLAGLSAVPVIIRDIPDEAAMAMALIENIQREDLNAIEEATALQRLYEEFSLSHEDIAKAVGKSRTTVTNLLRLLQLSSEVKVLVERGDLEMGHARALLTLSSQQQSEVAKIITAKALSVREAEHLVRRLQTPNQQKEKPAENGELQNIQTELEKQMGAKVQLAYDVKGKGKIIIHFNNRSELDKIMKRIG